MAQKSGITRKSIGNYERGDRIPPVDTLNKIAKALEVTPNDLVEFQGGIVNIGENIKRYRKLKKITQKQLAKDIGKSEITIRKYENNDTNPPVEVIKKIAKVRNVSIYELIGEPYEAVRNDIDLSLIPTSNLLEELNKRDDFPIKLELKNYES